MRYSDGLYVCFVCVETIRKQRLDVTNRERISLICHFKKHPFLNNQTFMIISTPRIDRKSKYRSDRGGTKGQKVSYKVVKGLYSKNNFLNDERDGPH